MGRSAFAILIPANNEEATIGELVAILSKEADVVVVDDGSEDLTAKVAKSKGAKVVSLPENMGYDAALASGIRYVQEKGYSGIVTCDADGQHLTKDVVSALKLVESHPLVVGVRSPLARTSERVFAWVTRYSVGIRDPLCGLKAYDLRGIPVDFSRYLLGSSGTGLALRLAAEGINVLNLPISIQERATGVPRFGGYFRANARIFSSLAKAFPLILQALLRKAKSRD